MVEIFGRVESNEITEEGQQRTVFRIPALSKSLARQRARANARLKDLSDFNVESIEKVEPGTIPGQAIFDITVTANR